MTDYVINLPLQGGDEVQLFGDYLNRFVDARSSEAALADGADGPFVMVRSDPSLNGELKTVIFQEGRTAAAFSSGWAEARGRRRLGARAPSGT
jgi:hypothetical protein